MKCALCNGTVSIVKGSIPFNSKPLGEIHIPGVIHSVCGGCGEITFSHEEAEKIDAYIKEKESVAINSLPIGEFIPLNEAAQMLGISKQAFSKHSRIKRGFIYSTMKGNSRLYYKPSIEEFKRNGKDGRINLFAAPYQKSKHTSVISFIPQKKITRMHVYKKCHVSVADVNDDNSFSFNRKLKNKTYIHC